MPMKGLNIIVAASRNGAIGCRGRMPWHLPADLRYFRQVTMGHDVIMGRRTFESIGRPLPGRRNLVLSHRPGLAIPGCEVFPSLAEAIGAAADGAFVIGGAEVYRQAWPLADRLYLTRVHTHVDDFDAAIPPIDPAEWRKVQATCLAADERNEFDLSFEVYARTRTL